MTRTQFGLWRLEILGEMCRLAFQRLADVAAEAAGGPRAGSRGHPYFPPGARAVLEAAVERKLAMLAAAFPSARPRGRLEAGKDAESLLARLGRAHRLWADAVNSLADDNELDVPRGDGRGRLRRTQDLVVEAILSDAELAGRIAASAGA
jgi:hypothetical protein